MDIFKKRFKLKDLYVGVVATQSAIEYTGLCQYSWSFSNSKIKFFEKTLTGFVSVLEGVKYPISNQTTNHNLEGKRVILGDKINLFAQEFDGEYQKLLKDNIKSVPYALIERWEEELNTIKTDENNYQDQFEQIQMELEK